MEPGTPIPALKVGVASYPLAWTTRSEVLISRHGFDVPELFAAITNRRRALYAICLGVYAALRPEHAPETPEEIGEWIKTDDAQLEAMKHLVAIIRHARPEYFKKESEKKSDSTN